MKKTVLQILSLVLSINLISLSLPAYAQEVDAIAINARDYSDVNELYQQLKESSIWNGSCPSEQKLSQKWTSWVKNIVGVLGIGAGIGGGVETYKIFKSGKPAATVAATALADAAQAGAKETVKGRPIRGILYGVGSAIALVGGLYNVSGPNIYHMTISKGGDGAGGLAQSVTIENLTKNEASWLVWALCYGDKGSGSSSSDQQLLPEQPSEEIPMPAENSGESELPTALPEQQGNEAEPTAELTPVPTATPSAEQAPATSASDDESSSSEVPTAGK